MGIEKQEYKLMGTKLKLEESREKNPEEGRVHSEGRGTSPAWL